MSCSKLSMKNSVDPNVKYRVSDVREIEGRVKIINNKNKKNNWSEAIFKDKWLVIPRVKSSCPPMENFIQMEIYPLDCDYLSDWMLHFLNISSS